MEEETKEVENETEKISKEFGINNIIHKEEFSLEGNKKNWMNPRIRLKIKKKLNQQVVLFILINKCFMDIIQ